MDGGRFKSRSSRTGVDRPEEFIGWVPVLGCYASRISNKRIEMFSMDMCQIYNTLTIMLKDRNSSQEKVDCFM